MHEWRRRTPSVQPTRRNEQDNSQASTAAQSQRPLCSIPSEACNKQLQQQQRTVSFQPVRLMPDFTCTQPNCIGIYIIFLSLSPNSLVCWPSGKIEPARWVSIRTWQENVSI